MLYGGIDVGAQSVKALLFDGQHILGQKLTISEEEADAAARKIFHELLDDLHIRLTDIEQVVATGWGAADVSFADRKSSEQVCAARGTHWWIDSARTVVDVGAEGSRVMKLGPDGGLLDFTNNAKCASGTGSFIELGAVYLKTPIGEMGPLSLAADGVAEVSSTCAVFAESVIISHIHNGQSRERIAAGVHKAAAVRIEELIGRLGLEEKVVLIGGGALNQGLVRMLEQMIGVQITVPEHPRLVTALGAAIQASRKSTERRRRRPKAGPES